jgi:hypothetical protein
MVFYPPPMWSVADFERPRILWLHFTPVVDPRRRNIGVSEPFLDLGNVGIVIEALVAAMARSPWAPI